MSEDTVLTLGLVGVIAVCVVGGISVVIWLQGKFEKLDEKFDALLRQVREQVNHDIARLHEKHELILSQHHQLDVKTETRFMPREDVIGSMAEIKTAVAHLRDDVQRLTVCVAKRAGDHP